MLAIPSIDIRGGVCADGRSTPVGDVTSVADPLAMSRTWSRAGFRRVHVRDLDAIAGRGSNGAILDDIARDGSAEVQIDVGAQETDSVERLLDAGATQVVLGPRAIEEPEWTERIVSTFPGMLLVATDVRERRVVLRGWIRNLPLDIFDVIDELCEMPLGGLLVSTTNASADVSRTTTDLNLLEDIAERCDFPVIATGGVSTMNDVRALEHRGVAAVVLDGLAFSPQLDARGVASEFGG